MNILDFDNCTEDQHDRCNTD